MEENELTADACPAAGSYGLHRMDRLKCVRCGKQKHRRKPVPGTTVNIDVCAPTWIQRCKGALVRPGESFPLYGNDVKLVNGSQRHIYLEKIQFTRATAEATAEMTAKNSAEIGEACKAHPGEGEL